MAIQYHETTGNYVHSNETISAMFEDIQTGIYMLEDLQVEFVDSLRNFHQSRGYLTPKQFRYLSAYYNEACGDWDMLPDPAFEE